MMMGTEETMKGEDVGAPHRNLREDAGVRHLAVIGTRISTKTGDTDRPQSIRRSINNYNKTETDERANLVRKTGLY